MKDQKGVREHEADELRKAKRLEPMHKSGKERYELFNNFEEEEDEPIISSKRESTLDYFDDEK